MLVGERKGETVENEASFFPNPPRPRGRRRPRSAGGEEIEGDHDDDYGNQTSESLRCLLPSSRRGCRISSGSNLEPRHRLEAYATLICGVSSGVSKAIFPGAPRTHNDHAMA